MFSDKRRTLLTLAVLLVAIALAAVPTFTPFGNKQTNKCMGYNKSRPGSTQKSLSAGSCADTPSNSVTLWNANGKGGPIVDQKNKRCVTSASNKPGASVDGKQCKAVPRKGGRRRRDDGEDSKDGDVPDFLLNPENYEWPPQQQWFKISNTSTEFSTSEIWKNGYGLCLEVTVEGFFRQYKCDPNNPNQNWFINYEPQPETPAVPETPVVTVPVLPPVVMPPVVIPPVEPTCPPRNCPSGQYQVQVTCECVCRPVDCPTGQEQDRESCDCYCDPDLCGPDEIQLDDCSCERPNTCGAWNNCDNGWELADGAANTECLLRGSSDSIPRCENDWCCVRSLPPVNTTTCGAWNNCPAWQYSDLEFQQESSIFTIKNPGTLCTETGPFDQGVPKCNGKTCCSVNPMNTCGQWNKCSGADMSVPTEFAIRWCSTPSRPMDGFPDCSDDWCCAETDYAYEPPVQCSEWNDCSVGWTLKTPTRQCTLPGYYLTDVPECNDNTCCAASDAPVPGETTCGAWVGGDNMCVDATGNIVGLVDAQDSYKACRTQAPYDSTPQCTNNYCCVESWTGTTTVGTACSAWNRCSVGLVLIDSAASTMCTSITIDISRPMAFGAADSPHFPACNDQLCCRREEKEEESLAIDSTPSHPPLDPIPSATDFFQESLAIDPTPSHPPLDPIPSATDFFQEE